MSVWWTSWPAILALYTGGTGSSRSRAPRSSGVIGFLFWFWVFVSLDGDDGDDSVFNFTLPVLATNTFTYILLIASRVALIYILVTSLRSMLIQVMARTIFSTFAFTSTRPVIASTRKTYIHRSEFQNLMTNPNFFFFFQSLNVCFKIWRTLQAFFPSSSIFSLFS